jgi:DNA-binding MarR family transcriptional regulator
MPLDHTGRALEAWNQNHPDLDLAPAHVLARIRRLAGLLEPFLDPPLARFGLSHAAFDTLSVLRRVGAPYQMSASEVASQCLRTPATLSTRIARLEREGLVRRTPDPGDGRSVTITLTERGLRIIDEAIPVYLEAERTALSGLDDDDRDHLAEILQRLLLTFEGYDENNSKKSVAHVHGLGMSLESLHHSLSLRRAVGLPERRGLIIGAVDASGPAAEAGLRAGDLILEVDGEPARSAVVVNHQVNTRVETDPSSPVIVTYSRQGEPDAEATLAPRTDGST